MMKAFIYLFYYYLTCFNFFFLAFYPAACRQRKGSSSVDGRGSGPGHCRPLHQLKVCQVHAEGWPHQRRRRDVLQVHTGWRIVEHADHMSDVDRISLY